MKGKSVIPSLPFVGREEEIGFLREVLQRTLNDEGKCIIIEGEIGIGKTRLLKEFRDTIDPSPFQVFSGKGMEGGRFMEPFSSMLSHYFSKIENPSQRITRYIPPHDLSILSHLTPQLLRYYPFEVSKSGEASLEMLFSSLFNFFSNLSNLHPLVIVIDDIHWLGEEALEFLEYLCVRIRDFLLAESYAQRFKTLAQRNNIKEYILEAGLKWFHIYLEEKRMEDAEKELKNLSSFRLESLSSLHQVEILMFQAIIEMEKGICRMLSISWILPSPSVKRKTLPSLRVRY